MFRQQPAWWQRQLQWIPASRFGAWLFARTLHAIDLPLLRASHGRISVPGVLSGLPVVTLTTVGAKSGLPRSVPVVGIEDGDRVVLIASSYGRPHNPGWYYNLRRNPDVMLMLHGKTAAYHAREVVGEEREAYWRRAVALYRGFAAYQQRSGGRSLPVLVLTPSAE